ncbi:MAG TPA: AAA family ATPase, partial [Candidatus Limnocylindria bacterium]|nr:AAA family ATPase [Candidatus Limnocylindria bacterium]
MRLLSATLRNYRIHRELKVDFDASRTLIGGANESGKSTLVEAMHRALFLRAKGNTEFHREMVSSHGGHPEVELQFESGGTTYLLKKRFGSTGTVTLTPANSPALTGDAAEAELARLLGVEPGAAGKVADAQWSHLWVWQRESGENPTEHANRQQASLIQRLQQSGGAVAMQSELDERVARDFSTLAETIFTLAGKAKVGSDLERAETVAASAQDEKNAAMARMDSSLQAIRDFDESSRAIVTANESLKGLENSKAATVARLAEVEKLRRDEIERAGLAKNAASAHAFLEGVHNQIATLRLTMAALSKALEPEKTVSTDLATKRDQAKWTLDRADQDHESATLRTRSQRLHRDLAQAWVAEFEKATRREELAAKWSQIKALDESLKERQQDLARLPALDSAQLKKIHKLENQKFLAEAALQALAARVEIITAKESVSVGGLALSAGETKVITEETDITAGSDLCIRIRPGGGAPLAETRQNLKEARRSLEEALEPHGLASVAEAAEIAGKRADLAAKIDGLKTTLGNLGADSLLGLMAEAEGAYTAAVAESQRRMTAAPEAHRPATLEGARTLLVDQNSLLEDLESRETILKTSRNIASKTLMEAEAALLKHHETMGQKTRQLGEHDAQLRLLLETNGDDASRSARLQSLHLDMLASAAALQSTRQSLEALQPEFLANDLARLNRALEQTKQGKVEAEK